DQLDGVERFGDRRVGDSVDEVLHSIGVGTTRKKDHSTGHALLEPLQLRVELDASHVRHEQIAEDDVELLATSDLRKRLACVREAIDLVIAAPQTLEGNHDGTLVIDHENAGLAPRAFLFGLFGHSRLVGDAPAGLRYFALRGPLDSSHQDRYPSSGADGNS